MAKTITIDTNAPVAVRVPIAIVARLQFDADARSADVTPQRIAAEIIAKHYGVVLPSETARIKQSALSDDALVALRKTRRDDYKQRRDALEKSELAKLRAQLVANAAANDVAPRATALNADGPKTR